MNQISETDAIQDKIAKTWLDSGRELSCISEVYFIIREWTDVLIRLVTHPAAEIFRKLSEYNGYPYIQLSLFDGLAKERCIARHLFACEVVRMVRKGKVDDS